MSLSSRYRHHQIRQILKSPVADVLSPRLRLVVRAVWNIPTVPNGHARCLADLAGYVTAEMEGNLAAFYNSFVHEHLRVCQSCAATYADLLEVAILDAQERLHCPGSPSPNLSFLETPND
jgi:predicted anti-sigma-YlaC factor YlaD